MTSSAALAIVCLVACGHGGEEVAIATPARLPDRIAPGVPHGGVITHVAITEQGDAALSLDNLGELRLWPSLDGKRPPVPIAAAGVSEVGLGSTGGDLLAALLDQAGAVRLLRLGRDGTVRGHAQLPGDVASVQLVMIDDGVLVVRADESIERYDAAGKLRGRIVPEAGERIGTIAVRAGNAAALIVKPADSSASPNALILSSDGRPAAPIVEHAMTLRWIVLTGELRWGTTVSLASPVLSQTLALAPDHRRIAVIGADKDLLEVIDLEPLPRAHDGPTLAANLNSIVGFTDDDHCAVIGDGVQWWTPPVPVKPETDPWAVQTPSQPSKIGTDMISGAIGDGIGIMGFGPSLALVEPTRLAYLGWKNQAVGTVTALGSRITFTASNTHVIWLDDQLAEIGDTDLSKMPGVLLTVVAWVDAHHAVGEVQVGNKFQVLLIDTDHLDHPATIATFPSIDRLEYQSVVGKLLVISQGQLTRFDLDLEHLTAKALPVLQTPGSLQRVWLLDPARAGGLIAITTNIEPDGQLHLQRYRNNDSGKPVKATTDAPIKGALLAVDATGTTYVNNDGVLVGHREGRADVEVPVGVAIGVTTVSHDTHDVALTQGSLITLVDDHGATRWQRPMWGAIDLMFTSDDRRLIVQTAGGIVALDRKTGERVGSLCGLGFGIQDTAPMVNTFGVSPVCEEVP